MQSCDLPRRSVKWNPAERFVVGHDEPEAILYMDVCAFYGCKLLVFSWLSVAYMGEGLEG